MFARSFQEDDGKGKSTTGKHFKVLIVAPSAENKACESRKVTNEGVGEVFLKKKEGEKNRLVTLNFDGRFLVRGMRWFEKQKGVPKNYYKSNERTCKEEFSNNQNC
ncbi:hypothetical protein CEXT_73851 [Caerostris extrusa]|uniref:Uncharacterized protein n=1 Tax=Caerostris extrusa TaxID=172846 RepID=A0AAV4P8H8_CAEEX|nr:hypothetical protein CEXT_73851 [Caerostris extrusa]